MLTTLNTRYITTPMAPQGTRQTNNKEQNMTNTYCIIDTHTGEVVATGLTFKGAIRSCDRRDNAYGSYRFIRKLEVK